jgi:hypothetical protein
MSTSDISLSLLLVEEAVNTDVRVRVVVTPAETQRNNSEDLGIDGSVTLEWILGN